MLKLFVLRILPYQVQIGDSLVYRIKRTLGKGLSGQVCVGEPVGPSAAISQIGLGAVEVYLRALSSHFHT